MNPIDQIRKALEAIKAAKAQKHAGLTLTAAQAEALLASHDAAVQRAAEMQEALEEISLAGMSAPMGYTEDETRSFHARQAWRFISIAARAITKDKK